MVLYNLIMNNININLGIFITALASIVSIIGTILALIKYLKSGFNKWAAETHKPLEEKIDIMIKEIDSVKLDNCKNYVVEFLSKIEEGRKVTNDELLRFSENYELYKSMGGNSYVHSWVERLKKEGKLDHKPMV